MGYKETKHQNTLCLSYVSSAFVPGDVISAELLIPHEYANT